MFVQALGLAAALSNPVPPVDPCPQLDPSVEGRAKPPLGGLADAGHDRVIELAVRRNGLAAAGVPSSHCQRATARSAVDRTP